VTPTLKVIMILESKETLVAPILGLKVIGTGGTFKAVKVAIPTFKFLLSSITVVPEIFMAIYIISTS
jgi:hypothetical protein